MRMNHLLRWFNDWSELQKADFVPVLASRMKAGKEGLINGDVADGIKAMDTNSDRPPSLFSCQVREKEEHYENARPARLSLSLSPINTVHAFEMYTSFRL